MFTGKATPKLGLPQWEPQNHPDFLTDMNDAFQKIDENAQAVGESVQDISDLQKGVADLQTLTQSLNEDSQEIIGQIGAINIALGNLRTETDKVDPIFKQVLTLEEIARRQSDTIHELQKINSVTQIWNGSMRATVGNSTITLTQVALVGNHIRVSIDTPNVSGNSYDTTKTFEFDATEILNVLTMLRDNEFVLYRNTSLILTTTTGLIIGSFVIQNLNMSTKKLLIGFVKGVGGSGNTHINNMSDFVLFKLGGSDDNA